MARLGCSSPYTHTHKFQILICSLEIWYCKANFLNIFKILKCSCPSQTYPSPLHPPFMWLSMKFITPLNMSLLWLVNWLNDKFKHKLTGHVTQYTLCSIMYMYTASIFVRIFSYARCTSLALYIMLSVKCINKRKYEIIPIANKW